MDLTIDVLDYLSQHEIREECRYAIRRAILDKFSKESEINRLITNLSYEFIFEAINEETGIDCIKKIKDTVAELVNKESSIKYELFRKADQWDKEEGFGQTILKAALKENEQLIKEKVKEAINNYDFLERKELQERMEELFHEMLEEKLFCGKEGRL